MNPLLPALNAILLMLYATTPNRSIPDIICFEGVILEPTVCWKELAVENATSCVLKCGRAPECLFAFWTNGCNLCSEGSIRVQWPGTRVGVKNIERRTVDFCPAGTLHLKRENVKKEDPPSASVPTPDSQENTPLDEKSELIPVSQASMSSTPDTTKKSTTITPKRSCPAGWTPVQNEWCSTKEYQFHTSFTYSQARSLCERRTGSSKKYLGGLEFKFELDSMISFVKTTSYSNDLGFWIDGMQSSDCSSNCFPNHFTFSDPHLKNFTGYDWYKDTKGNVKYGGKNTCLQVMFPKNRSDPRFGKVTFANCISGKDEFTRSAVMCITSPI